MIRLSQLIVVCLIGWAIPILGVIAIAKAEPGVPNVIEHNVYVDPSVPGAPLLASRIHDRIKPGDNITVAMLGESFTVAHDAVIKDLQGKPGIWLVTIGDELLWHTDGRPDETFMSQRKTLNDNVLTTGIDKQLAMIRDIHAWQAANPVPVPPPPPPPPFDWTPVLIGAPIALVIGGLTFLVVYVRRRHSRLLKTAEAQANWSLDDYLKGNQ